MTSISKDIYERFDVLETLGSGSFGKVFKVCEKRTGKTYACKEINYGKMSEKEKELLVSEVNILRELRTPQIVRYIDRVLDKTITKIYIIMEYCAGGDLAAYIRRHRRERTYVKEEVIWNVLIQVVIALNACHEHKPTKVLHRDIKPGNIMLDGQQKIKLGDFGLSRTLGEDSYARTVVGTPLYMSPEQYKRNRYDEKCDIWSLGCVIYEMACLRPPFEAATQELLSIKVKTGRYSPLPSHYSPELKDIIAKMLALNPEQRPSTKELLAHPRINVCQAELRGQTVPPPENRNNNDTERRDRDFGKKLSEVEQREREVERRERELIKRAAELDQKERELNYRERELILREERMKSGQP